MNAPTAGVVQLEASLREKYDTLNKPHIASILRNRQAKFDAITDPIKAAEFSVPLFLQRYFLNVDGTPDRRKTTSPITLAGFSNRAEMHSTAEKIPGLHTCSAGNEPYRVLAIGWNSSAVSGAAGKAAAVGHAQHAKEMDEERTMRMDAHREFLDTLKVKQKGTKKKAGKGAQISHATGTYLVECRNIEEEWPELAQGGLYMTIVPDEENKGRLVAEFEFGVLEGIMRFRQVDEEWLDDRDSEGEGDTDEDSEGEEDTDEEDLEEGVSPSEEEHDDDDDAELSRWTSGKRKRSTAKSQPTRRQPQAKKQKTLPPATDSTKFKLLFQWRGCETGEGEIQLGGSNKGYIEFGNSDCTTFTGSMDAPYFTKAKLKGYKVAKGDGTGINVSWEDFSGSVYERERIGRWH